MSKETENFKEWLNTPDAAAFAAPSGSATDYAIALQRAIEYHCDGREIPEEIVKLCPHHARKLNGRLPPRKDLYECVEETNLDDGGSDGEW